jgi:hypothetical protein
VGRLGAGSATGAAQNSFDGPFETRAAGRFRRRNSGTNHEQCRILNSKEDIVSQDESTVRDLLELNQRLLDSIASADWETYASLCHPSLSAFEPESSGHLVEGLDFHRFYFGLGAAQGPVNTTMTSPHVRVMGEAAVVSCVRLTQRCDADGKPVVSRCEETRVWQRIQGQWRHVHFHRSMAR